MLVKEAETISRQKFRDSENGNAGYINITGAEKNSLFGHFNLGSCQSDLKKNLSH